LVDALRQKQRLLEEEAAAEKARRRPTTLREAALTQGASLADVPYSATMLEPPLDVC
jgi:hypothetical protein